MIFIDYLQIIAPSNPRATDKQNTDTAVFELKEISKDFSIPIFIISSFNRENYFEPVSMTSFKESGIVEYSADVLFGLQFSNMDYISGEKDKNRKERIIKMLSENNHKKVNKEPVEIELKCLKNRNGTPFDIKFKFISNFNCFEEMSFKLEKIREKTQNFNNTPKKII